jgi:hypothetical protein
MKDDYILNILFWFAGLISIGVFAKLGVEELIFMQIENENRQIKEEFLEKYETSGNVKTPEDEAIQVYKNIYYNYEAK